MSSPELIQQLLSFHARSPRNRGELLTPSGLASIENPICGDRITLYLGLDGERISNASFQGHGCIVSQASASMLAESISGLTREEARELGARFRELIQGQLDEESTARLGDLRAFAGIARLPARRRCALLAWDALQQIWDRLEQ